MSVTLEKLNNSISEARRFIYKAELAIQRFKDEPYMMSNGCKETGAVRRASMDLSNALVEIRKSDD